MRDNKIIKENTPIENISYNHIFFANKIIILKLFKIEELSIANHTIQLNSVYPMTGLARLIYISNNKIKIYGEKITEFSDKNKNYFFSLYFLILFIYFFFIFFCYFNLVYRSKKK